MIDGPVASNGTITSLARKIETAEEYARRWRSPITFDCIEVKHPEVPLWRSIEVYTTPDGSTVYAARLLSGTPMAILVQEPISALRGLIGLRWRGTLFAGDALRLNCAVDPAQDLLIWGESWNDM